MHNPDDPTDLFQEVWSFLHLGEKNGIIVVHWHIEATFVVYSEP